MAITVRRLRWFIAAAALLLIVVVGGYLGFGRYRALEAYLSVIRRAGAKISHDTNGYTYTQSDGHRTVFTLHAKRATQLGDGRWSLYGVNVVLYSRDGQHNDVINGDQFTYNEQDGVVRAIGEVHMDLEAPDSLASAGRTSLKPLAGSPPGTHAEPANVIHVRTSGVVYLRKLGVAATDQPVEFYYGGISGTAQGAEYNTSLSTLRLLSNVVANGTLRGRSFVLHAASADIDRTANVATLPHTVGYSDGRDASADLTLLKLRKDGSIASAKATGNVVLTSGTERITAAQFDGTFTQQTVPETARLSGGVRLADSDALRPASGSASAADLAFDAHGALTRVVATGTPRQAPQLTLVEKRAVTNGLQREMHGDRIVADFNADSKGSQLRELHTTGAAETHGESLALSDHPAVRSLAGVKLTVLTADDLDLTLALDAKGNPEPQHLTALGNTLLRQQAPTGEVETSSGDKLTATFAPAEAHEPRNATQLALASALQTGHVVIRRTSPPTVATKTGPAQQLVATATAATASYDGASNKLTLSGDAHLTQDNATLTATTVVLDQHTQDADAIGNVQATLVHADTQPSKTQATQPTPYTHVLSASAHFTHPSRQVEFRGTDAAPARLWQAASQVQAATLLLDDLQHTFSARAAAPNALIHAIFAGSPSAAHQPASTHELAAGRSSYVRAAAAKLDYSDPQRVAVFSGPQGVTLQDDAGTIHAQRAMAFLAPAAAKSASAPSPTPFNGSLERVVISGDVLLDQPGRHGTGEQLIYTAATGQSLLTGTPGRPPHIVDAQHGSITGTSLLFGGSGGSGSTIVVTGAPQSGTSARVHTETHVQPGKAERQ